MDASGGAATYAGDGELATTGSGGAATEGAIGAATGGGSAAGGATAWSGCLTQSLLLCSGASGPVGQGRP